jgi:hypothetical protein
MTRKNLENEKNYFGVKLFHLVCLPPVIPREGVQIFLLVCPTCILINFELIFQLSEEKSGIGHRRVFGFEGVEIFLLVCLSSVKKTILFKSLASNYHIWTVCHQCNEREGVEIFFLDCPSSVENPNRLLFLARA